MIIFSEFIETYLTKNGRVCYTVPNIDEEEEQCVKAEKYNRMQAQLRRMCELSEGRRSGEEEGWISSEDVRSHFRDRANATIALMYFEKNRKFIDD